MWGCEVGYSLLQQIFEEGTVLIGLCVLLLAFGSVVTAREGSIADAARRKPRGALFAIFVAIGSDLIPAWTRRHAWNQKQTSWFDLHPHVELMFMAASVIAVISGFWLARRPVRAATRTLRLGFGILLIFTCIGAALLGYALHGMWIQGCGVFAPGAAG